MPISQITCLWGTDNKTVLLWLIWTQPGYTNKGLEPWSPDCLDKCWTSTRQSGGCLEEIRTNSTSDIGLCIGWCQLLRRETNRIWYCIIYIEGPNEICIVNVFLNITTIHEEHAVVFWPWDSSYSSLQVTSYDVFWLFSHILLISTPCLQHT